MPKKRRNRSQGKRPAFDAWDSLKSLYNHATGETTPLLEGERIYVNSRYLVAIRPWPVPWISQDGEPAPDGVLLSIKRNHGGPVSDWRDKQRIKNELCGPEREAVELFPAESRLVDIADQCWIYVLPEGARWPFGFEQRMVAEGDATNGRAGSQRPFEVKPDDLIPREKIREATAKLQDRNWFAGERVEEESK